MKDLIEALTILSKYTDARWPTHCEHDSFQVCVDPKMVSAEDKVRLKALDFHESSEESFVSYRFGSC